MSGKFRCALHFVKAKSKDKIGRYTTGRQDETELYKINTNFDQYTAFSHQVYISPTSHWQAPSHLNLISMTTHNPRTHHLTHTHTHTYRRARARAYTGTHTHTTDLAHFIIISSHLSLNREGHWGTTADFVTSFLHFSLFSPAV